MNKWLEFFLDGVIETSQAAIETVRKITLLRERDIVKISVMKILPKLFAQPIVSVALIQQWANFSTRTGAQKLIDRLVEVGILKIKDEAAKYSRTYVYREYLDIFEKSLT